MMRRPSLRTAIARLGEPAVLRNMLWLALLACSITLFVYYVALVPSLPKLVLANELPKLARGRVFVAVAASGVVGPLAGLLWYRYVLSGPAPSKKKDYRFQRIVERARPLALLWLLPILVDLTIQQQRPFLSFALALALAAALSHWLVAARDRPQRPRAARLERWRGMAERWAPWIVLAGALSYTIYVSVGTIDRHHTLHTHAYDLGIFENALANTLAGRVMFTPLEGSSHLGVHFSPIVLALTPLYAICPRAETLLVAQSALIGFAAWPLFLVGKRVLRTSVAPALIALAYLLHPALGGANFYDFHELAFGPGLFFLVFLFFLDKRWRLFWLCIVLLLMVKEDMAIVVVVVGLYAMAHRQLPVGLGLVGLGLASFLLYEGTLAPYWSGNDASFAWYYRALDPHKQGFFGVIETLAVNPSFALRHAVSEAKALYLLHLLVPLYFLCLRDKKGWLLMSYPLLMTLASSNEAVHRIGFQYPLQVLPYAFVGTIVALGGQAPRAASPGALGWRQKRSLLALVVLTLVCTYQTGMIYPRTNFLGGFGPIDFDYTAKEEQRYQELSELTREIPPDAAVTASEALVPHLNGRPDLWTIRNADRTNGMASDYLLLWRHEKSPNVLPILQQSTYEVVKRTNNFVVYRRVSAEPN